MTSRNLFFKLMKEDLKRRLWAIGFSVLALFFAMPMAAAMGIGDIGNQYKQWLISGTGYENMVPEALRQTKILRLAGEILGFENYALFMVVGARGDDSRTHRIFVSPLKETDRFLQQPPSEEGDAVCREIP